jgi:ATP-dependent exoDNAse (exonuclease V) beta subunit
MACWPTRDARRSGRAPPGNARPPSCSDGQLLEGNVDLAFETEEGFLVIDFKTDRAEGELQASYADRCSSMQRR